MEITPHISRLARFFLARPGGRFYVTEIADHLGVDNRGTMSRTLARMEKAGWLASSLQSSTPGAAPPDRAARRRYYWLVPAGVEPARAAATVHSDDNVVI